MSAGDRFLYQRSVEKYLTLDLHLTLARALTLALDQDWSHIPES